MDSGALHSSRKHFRLIIASLRSLRLPDLCQLAPSGSCHSAVLAISVRVVASPLHVFHSGVLYSRFAGPSIYLGARSLMMLLFATLTVWDPRSLYFWVSLLALCISPFIFNPHQFAWNDFFIDYRDFLRWMSRGNSRSHAHPGLPSADCPDANHWLQTQGPR